MTDKPASEALDKVICPNCVHQFRAIPEDVQHALRAAEQRADKQFDRANEWREQAEKQRQNIEELRHQRDRALSSLRSFDPKLADHLEGKR